MKLKRFRSILYSTLAKSSIFYEKCYSRLYAKLFHRPIVSKRINLLNESCKALTEHSLSRIDDTIVVLVSTCNNIASRKDDNLLCAITLSITTSIGLVDASFLPLRDVVSLVCVIVFQLSRGLRIAMGRRAVSVVGRKPMGEPLPMNVGIATVLSTVRREMDLKIHAISLSRVSICFEIKSQDNNIN